MPSSQMLREMRLLLLEEGHCFRDQALSFCNMQWSQPREVLDASSCLHSCKWFGAGIGVTLIPEMAVAVETRSASVSVARSGTRSPRDHRHDLAARRVLWQTTPANFRGGLPLGGRVARATRPGTGFTPSPDLNGTQVEDILRQSAQ